MDGITLGDMITLGGVLVAAGSIIAQVRHLDKKVDRLETKMDNQGDQVQANTAKIVRLDTLASRTYQDLRPVQ